MLIVKVMFFRDDKAPVTLDSKRVNVTNEMTYNEMSQEAEKFYYEFLKKYPEMEKAHIGRHFILQG